MKKLLLLISAVMVAVTLSAGDSFLQDKGVFSDWKFAPLQLGLGVKNWRNLVDNQTDTVFSLVLCSMSQKSAVISLSAVGGVFNNYGISIAGINGSKENYGIKIGLINYKDFFINENFYFTTTENLKNIVSYSGEKYCRVKNGCGAVSDCSLQPVIRFPSWYTRLVL